MTHTAPPRLDPQEAARQRQGKDVESVLRRAGIPTAPTGTREGDIDAAIRVVLNGYWIRQIASGRSLGHWTFADICDAFTGIQTNRIRRARSASRARSRISRTTEQLKSELARGR